MLSVDVNKACGPDKISNRFIKLSVESLYLPLTCLFNKSLYDSTFPKSWKEASVFPLHKKGSVNECQNYRPVALTSCISKIFEKCVFKYVFNFFLDNNVLTNLQSGFMPGDCTSINSHISITS